MRKLKSVHVNYLNTVVVVRHSNKNLRIVVTDLKILKIDVSAKKKATHTDKYLHFNSHHPLQQKRSVVRTLLDRAKNIPSTDKDKKSEVQHVVDALKTNGYTDQFLKSCRRTKPPKALNQPQNNQPQSQRLCYFAIFSRNV